MRVAHGQLPNPAEVSGTAITTITRPRKELKTVIHPSKGGPTPADYMTILDRYCLDGQFSPAIGDSSGRFAWRFRGEALLAWCSMAVAL